MKIKKGSSSYIILTVLAAAADGYAGFEDFTYHTYRQYSILDLKKSAFASAIRRLRDSGYIESKKIDTGKIIFKLTKLGKDFIPFEFDESTWDGKWRIVIFDIPENKKVVRNLFRRNLKKWGFKKWQQSVWVSKRDITQRMKELIIGIGITDWVAVIESEDPVFSNIMLNGRTP